MTYEEAVQVLDGIRAFETVLRAEFGSMGVFLAVPKNAMDIMTLVEAGEQAFPPSLSACVPEAVADARQAMSCIAFELPTAAAFHLHRANEAALKAYWIAVAEGRPVPKLATMGTIIAAMETGSIGREEIRSALWAIVRLHRNPTIHPEQSLADVEEAINLYGSIRSVIGFMLKEIPVRP